jgi:hypothetical protein
VLENSEVDRAVSALTAEILKLSPLAEGEERAALSITIENALTRLSHAILEQAIQAPAKSPEEAQPAAV